MTMPVPFRCRFVKFDIPAEEHAIQPDPGKPVVGSIPAIPVSGMEDVNALSACRLQTGLRKMQVLPEEMEKILANNIHSLLIFVILKRICVHYSW
jgi:hypothetical protein